MKYCNDLIDLLKEIHRNEDTTVRLKVVTGRDGSPKWRESRGSITIKLAESGRTYTISMQTYNKVMPYIVAK